MKSLPREVVILLTIISMGWSQQEEVVIGQEGHQVVLPRSEKGVDVSWRFGSSKDNIQRVVITSLQRSSPTYGPDMKGRVNLATSNISLTIFVLTREDFGYYSCEVGVGGKKSIFIFRLYKATVKLDPVPLVVASQELFLECVVENLSEGLVFQWKSPQNIGEGKGEKLTIDQVTEKHHGGWTCIITHKGSEFFIKFSITVVDLTTGGPLGPLYTTSSSRLLIPCYISAGLELNKLSSLQPIIGRWTFTPRLGEGNEVVKFTQNNYQWEATDNNTNWKWSEGNLKNNLSLVRTSVQETDVGTYRCELILKDGFIISREVEVNMLKVSLSPAPPGRPIYLGEAFNVSCSLVDPKIDKSLTMKWIVPEKSSASDLLRESHPALLSITQASEKDKGRWSCQLMKDTMKLVSADLMLKVESAPVNLLLWLSLSGAGILLIFIIMIILKLVQHLRQRVHCRRRPKKKYCRCKNPQLKGFYKT